MMVKGHHCVSIAAPQRLGQYADVGYNDLPAPADGTLTESGLVRKKNHSQIPALNDLWTLLLMHGPI